VRARYVPLGRFLAQGQGGAGKAELDSVQSTPKRYWKIFWPQLEIADSIVTPSQKELLSLLTGIVGVPKQDPEHSHWQLGHPVRLSDQVAAKPSAPTGGMTNRTGGADVTRVQKMMARCTGVISCRHARRHSLRRRAGNRCLRRDRRS
jgi:hypothetical protein